MDLLRAIIGFFIAIIAITFAVMNRHHIDVSWSPFHDPVSLPLFAACLGIGALGFLLGAIVCWMYGGHVRRAKRQQKRHIKALEKELETYHKQEPTPGTAPVADLFPKTGHKR